MPISSFHGLRKNSVPVNAWNSTRTSVQRNPSRGSAIVTSYNGRKRPVGVPRLWDNDYHEAFDKDRNDDEEKYSRSYPNGRILRRLSATSRPKSARLVDRGLKRRDTFPRFAAEIGSTRTEGRDYRRSKSDPSIIAEKKRRKSSTKTPKRPSTLWTVGKKEEKCSSSTSRRRKVNNCLSPTSFSSPDGSLNGGLSRKRPNQGDRVVCILNKKPQLGILKYVGTTHFADGEWCGIFLDEPCGKNDGSVRGVRYFRCKNKHGIFVHSHKVKAADDITLSRLNLLESPCSPQASEEKAKTAVNTEQVMSSSDVEIVRGGRMAYQHRDVKSLRLTRRNRSVSLDRYLFLKAKQLAKGFNILLHNVEKGDKMNTLDQNGLNRCRSLPKITKGNFCDSKEYRLITEMAPLEKNVWHGEGISNGEGKKVDPHKTAKVTGAVNSAEEGINSLNRESQRTFSQNSPSENSLNISNGFHAASGGSATVHKVGHAVSLDTGHLMIEKGQLTMSNCSNDDITSASHHANKEDPFIQGRHCSCPSLHCADHFSESIKTCLDLGRTERSIIPEAEDDDSVETDHAQETHHKSLGCSHSQSEALGKLFQKTEVVRSKSTSSRGSELTRMGSWPWLSSSPKQSLRRYSSSSNINTCGRSGDYGDVFEGLTSVLTPVEPILDNTVQRCLNLNNVDASDNIAVNKAVKPTESQDQATDADSNYADSLSGSQASLSSTGTSDSKGKKKSTTKRIPSSAKGCVTKSRAMPTRSNNASKPAEPKQSRLEQMRQQQNSKGPLSSAGNKSQLPKTTATSAVGNNGVKIQKRHTLATLGDVKSFVPRPSISKRPVSAGITEQSPRDEAKSSKLPVKKMGPSPPTQISKPAALPKMEKKIDTASVQRRHSAAASRPPVAPIVKRDSGLVRSDSKARKVSKSSVIPQKASAKEKETSVAGQKALGKQTPSAVKGPRGSTAATTTSKPQTSRVIRSSSSVKAKVSVPSKEANSKPSSISSNKKPVQAVKQTLKQTPSSQKQGTSKLPRKVSSQHSNASDSVSVTSSVKDQELLEDLDSEVDALSARSEASDHDARVFPNRHLQQDNISLNGDIPFDSDETDASKPMVADSPVDVPCRIMPPDLLSETPYLSKHSVGIQVEDDSHLIAIRDLKEKGKHLHELIKQKTELCWQLQNQIDDNSVDFVAASVMILSVVRKLLWSQKYSNQLQRKIESTLQEMKVIQEKLVEEEENSVKLQEEMMYQSSEHAVAIETLKADYENVLEQTSSELKRKHQGEITLALETHRAQVHEMRQQQEKELSEIKKAHDDLVASVKEEHRDEIADLDSKHSSAIDELVEEHQVEIETIKADYEEQQSDFKEKYDKLVSEHSSLNKKYQQLHDDNQRDIETRIQEAIKKYESLPAELESIKAVLEMKNEEIKQLRREKMEKYLELERLEDVKAQTKKLQQENESLSFVVESKSRFERQLSVERDTLRNSLERESAKSKRLSLENEELQWRLVNTSSPPCTPTEEGGPMPKRNSYRLSASYPDIEAIDE
ncbi:hypothetical protein ACROYT_G019453 [Oculina patagonica]